MYKMSPQNEMSKLFGNDLAFTCFIREEKRERCEPENEPEKLEQPKKQKKIKKDVPSTDLDQDSDMPEKVRVTRGLARDLGVVILPTRFITGDTSRSPDEVIEMKNKGTKEKNTKTKEKKEKKETKTEETKTKEKKTKEKKETKTEETKTKEKTKEKKETKRSLESIDVDERAVEDVDADQFKVPKPLKRAKKPIEEKSTSLKLIYVEDYTKVFLVENSNTFFVVVPKAHSNNPSLHPDMLRQRYKDNPDVNAIQKLRLILFLIWRLTG
jgi:hypothetical protein